MSRSTVAMQVARRKLAIAWFVAAALMVLIMVGRSLSYGFGDRVIDAWGWFLPTLMPTLTLIMSTFALDMGVASMPAQFTGKRRVDTFFLNIAMAFSIFYLVLVLMTLLIPADTLPGRAANPLAAMELSNLWLGPIQGLTAGAIGWFFLSAKDTDRRDDDPPGAQIP
jgi:hypothetical protein